MVLHAQAKVLVFFSTCKQTKFAFEAFRRLRPGVPLRALHGKMKQLKRMAVFYEFSEAQVRDSRAARCSANIMSAICRTLWMVLTCLRNMRVSQPGHMYKANSIGAKQLLSCTQAMVLFATDIAARGLDFPTIDWVLQASLAPYPPRRFAGPRSRHAWST